MSLLQHTPSRLALEWQFETSAAWGGPRDSVATPFRGWQGKWLAVRIPADAHVTAMTMNVGSEPVRASVWRNGTKLKEVSLKGAAVIPLDGAGGDYRLEGLGGALHLRDLDVLGQPGAERRSVTKLPEVRYGSLDAGEHISGPWPDLVSYCEKHHGDRCNEGQSGVPSSGSNLSIGFTSAGNRAWLAASTKRGWFVLRERRDVDPSSLQTERPEAGAPFLRFEYVERSDQRDGADLGGEIGKVFVDATRWLVVCRNIDDWIDCDERHALGTFQGFIADDRLARADAGPRAPFPPPSGRWNEPKAPRVLPDGGVTVE